MRLKSGFILRKIAGKFMAVPVGARTKELHGMIALNETGAFLWEHLHQACTVDELVALLRLEYEVEEETARNAVIRFGRELQEQGVLEDEGLSDLKS